MAKFSTSKSRATKPTALKIPHSVSLMWVIVEFAFSFSSKKKFLILYCCRFKRNWITWTLFLRVQYFFERVYLNGIFNFANFYYVVTYVEYWYVKKIFIKISKSYMEIYIFNTYNRLYLMHQKYKLFTEIVINLIYF